MSPAPELLVVGVSTLVIWLVLIFGRDGFWLARERDDRRSPADPASWPAVVAVVPARDEGDVVARAIGSLLAQDYPGDLRVILVDDGSTDATAGLAREAAQAGARRDRFEVLAATPLASGWTGKLAAVAQGVELARRYDPKYLLLTDADIGHEPEILRTLVARAEAGRLKLASVMVRLHCETAAERFLSPAFVFFFQMRYPFSRANRPASRLAAGAGGCMLVEAESLARAGGVAAIRTALIDDCTLAAMMKRQGPIWIGLTQRSASLRPYLTVGQIGRMVSRSAYAQLRFSPWRLAGTVLGLALTYLAPPALALFARGPAEIAGGLAWLLMAISFQPTLALYRRSPLWGLALPAIAATYAVFTCQSAVQFWRGRGGMWKGRAQAMAT